MKNQIKLTNILLGILASFFATAQVNCPDTVTEISTDFNNPINTQFDVSHRNKTNPYINHFNWSGFDGNDFDMIPINLNANWHSSIITPSMGSPFNYASPAMSNHYSYLYAKSNGFPPANAIERYEDLDWSWERGWELMFLHNGYFPNGEDITIPDANRVSPYAYQLANNRVPFYFLYNRYTGKLRMLATVSTEEWSSIDYTQTLLGYYVNKERPINISSVFRNLANYDRPLDLPTTNTGVTAVNSFTNNNLGWFSNDFQLAYDPCVCNYPSRLNLEINGIDTFKVSLYGRQLQTTVGVNQVEKDFLSNSSINHSNETGSSLIYKKTETLYDDYLNQLQKYNDDLDDYNSISNQLKINVLDLSKKAVTAAVGGAFPTKELKSFILKHAITIKGKQLPDTNTADGWAKAAQEASKSIAGKGFDYFTQNFVTSKPTAPTMPTATLSEMRMVGSITGISPLYVSGFGTPGSIHANQSIAPIFYPIYNKPVGLFALLETPQISYALDQGLLPTQILDTALCVSIYNSGPTSFTEYRDSTYGAPKTKLFKSVNSCHAKLTAPLKFKYNDAAGIDKKKTETYVSMIYEYDVDNSLITPYYKTMFNGHKIDEKGYRTMAGNMELMHDYVDEYNKTLQTRVYESEWINMKEIHDHVFGLEFFDSIINTTHPITRSSNNNPVDCKFFTETTLSQHWPVKLKSIKMKIMADIYFTTNEDINTTQVFTYKVYDRDMPETVTAMLTELDGASSLKQYKLGTVNLHNQHVKVGHHALTSTNGTNLIIDAEYVNISGNITVQPGYTLVINAAKQINVEPEADIAPEVILQAKRYFSTPAFNEATTAQLAAFCSGNNQKYQAYRSFSKTTETPSPKPVEDITEPAVNPVFYPNPANNQLFINLINAANYTITLTDLMGKELQQITLTNQSTAQLHLNQYTDGIYLIKVQSNGYNKTQKIVVKH